MQGGGFFVFSPGTVNPSSDCSSQMECWGGLCQLLGTAGPIYAPAPRQAVRLMLLLGGCLHGLTALCSILIVVALAPEVQMYVCNREVYGFLPVPLRSHSTLQDEAESFMHVQLEVMGESVRTAPGGPRCLPLPTISRLSVNADRVSVGHPSLCRALRIQCEQLPPALMACKRLCMARLGESG